MTTRPAVRERVRSVCAELGLPPPQFIERVDQLLESGTDSAVLFLDLGSCCTDPNLTPIVRTWDADRPGSEVVVFTPLLDRERELRTVIRLIHAVPFGHMRVLTGSDFYRDEVWHNLRELRERAALQTELRRELLAAVRVTGRPLRGEPVVLQILHDASRQVEIEVAAEQPLFTVRVNRDLERKTTWKLLHSAGQLPASWLLLIFRVLWFTKLYERGWCTEEIARFMGFPTARYYRRTVKRRFGLGIRELKRVPYERALRWAALLVTTSHVPVGRDTVQALIEPLLATLA